MLSPGDPAPWFRAASPTNPRYVFDTAAGRYIVLCFLGSATDKAGAAVEAAVAHRALLDDVKACFFGVTPDPADRDLGRIREMIPGVRYFLDFDGALSKLYGAIPNKAPASSGLPPVRRFWLVIDPTLRVLKAFPFAPDGSDRSAVFAFLEGLLPPDRFAGPALQAPILFLPNVFEPEFCRRLIDQYEAKGGEESGFMREICGKTVYVSDPRHKRRWDCEVTDPDIIAATQARVRRRIVPEIAKAHQFNVTRMERHIVGCYRAEDGGHFRPHRDNTTKGTAHRRFAVSINLNSDFEGGEISFPEYGARGFKPPPGGAVVFSCSLLHAVSMVTAGRRYAFLPFLYDDAAAKIRAANNVHLGPSVPGYEGE